MYPLDWSCIHAVFQRIVFENDKNNEYVLFIPKIHLKPLCLSVARALGIPKSIQYSLRPGPLSNLRSCQENVFTANHNSSVEYTYRITISAMRDCHLLANEIGNKTMSSGFQDGIIAARIASTP